jgi:predicted phosphodiesterase
MRRIAGLTALLAIAAAAGAAPALVVGPYVQNVSATSAVVMWETTEAVAGKVAYGTGEQLGNAVGDEVPLRLHELRITGLNPATSYAYRVSWPGYTGATIPFRTLPGPKETRFRIVVYGDTRSDPETHKRIADAIAAQQPALVVHTGDLVADGQRGELWKPEFFDPLAQVMRSVALFPAVGNHERESPYYYQHLSLPGNESWYSFDCGIAHFVVIDTEQPFEQGSAQYAWLQQHLASLKDPGRWLIAVFHVPMYHVHETRDVNATRWAFERLFEWSGVDLVVNGHDHYYMRSYPVGPMRALTGAARLDPGVRYGPVHIIAGGGGAPLYGVTERPWAACAEKAYSFVVLDFDGPKVEGTTYNIDGEVIDRFAAERGKAAPAEQYCAYEPTVLERDLSAGVPPLKVTKGQPVDASVALKARSPFPVQVAGAVVWEGPEGWTVTGTPTEFTLERGHDLELKYRVQGVWSSIKDVPTVTVRLTDAEGGLDFRNREFTFGLLREP